MSLGEQIMQGQQSYGGRWNLGDGLLALEDPLMGHLGETLEDHNLGLCGGYEVLALVGRCSEYQGIGELWISRQGKPLRGWILGT